MEIKDVQLVKPFGPLIMLVQLPEGVIKVLNEIVDVIYPNRDMGGRLAGVIETESEITHSMLEEKKVMDIFHACLLYTSPSPRDRTRSRMPSSA